MTPRAVAAANAVPWENARKNATGAEVNGNPTSQPPSDGPQRRPARLDAPTRSGVRTSFGIRLSRGV
ncbi:MAG: hypothetical protein ACRELS_21530 [Candidatus Rokuibacteriota bacterium]